MSLVVDGIVNLLAAEPDAALPANRVGDRAPSTTGDLPWISVSLTVDPPRGTGLGSFLREGHQLVKNTAVVLVSATPDSFLPDLATLRILPLPLKRNPASHTAGFSDADLSVRRVTDPANPVAYRIVQRPVAREEFAIDAANAQIRFGAPQNPADKLEVVHWTQAFRDDIVSVRYAGSMNLDAWANDAGQVVSLARKIQAKLAGPREMLRGQGFAILNGASLGAAASILQQPGSGSSFGAWRQTLSYRFAFETELGGEASAGLAIRRIDVHPNDALNEPFTVPAAT